MDFRQRYSRLDNLLQRIAFSNLNIQKAVADIEDRMYAKQFRDVAINQPVFITSLPRAGTTLFLELIGALDIFVAHSYRQMPFLLLPLLWYEISHKFRKTNSAMERAHSDGMTIDYDSLEAFEEVIWHAFWPEKYLKDQIIPWSAGERDKDREFDVFLKNHIRKLIALRAACQNTGRYVSKNNANISRIPKIFELFPDAIILIPFRNPVDHVGSMLRQHLHFNKIHAEDKFAKKYMADIGHFDFGANFRPIDFSGWSAENKLLPDSADFWLAYWFAAFEYILKNPSKNIRLVCYEKCCKEPVSALSKIAETIGLEENEPLVAQASRFRKPNSYDAEKLGLNSDQLNRCLNLYSALQERALV